MRKLAMLSTALLGLASFHPTFAQNQSAPQPGLPPGASVGAVNAQPPAATGQLSTTQTSPAVAPSPVLTPTPAPVATRRVVRRRRRVVRRHHVTHPAPAAAPAATQ